MDPEQTAPIDINHLVDFFYYCVMVIEPYKVLPSVMGQVFAWLFDDTVCH